MIGAVADAITDAGHDVTFVMPIIDTNERNRTGLKSTKKVIFVEPCEYVKGSSGENFWSLDVSNPSLLYFRSEPFGRIHSAQCHEVLSNSELLDRMRTENFDLAITTPFGLCGYIFIEAINVRAHVTVLASGRFEHVSRVIGQPISPSFVPAVHSVHGTEMTLWQRFMNVLQGMGGDYFYSNIGDMEVEEARKVIDIRRSWRDTLAESSFVFINSIPLLDFPEPRINKIIPIGGIAVKPRKSNLTLPQKWDQILSLRRNTVLISFGSVAKSVLMPDEFKKSFLKVFESMSDTTFIWKYEDENDKLAAHLDNVYLGSWLPQNELLADSRLTLFVTHGGMASTTELALMGKPCVMVPLFADQTRNAHMLKRHGGAIVLEKGDLGNWEKIRDSIQTIINNPSYRKNAEHLADMLNNQPTNPKETLVKHVEFAAKFGKLPSIDPYSRHQSFVEYFLLDIIAIFILISLISIYVIYKALHLAIPWCFRRLKLKIE